MSDVYVALHISTTADENGVYVGKDSSEIIELLWCLLDASSAEEILHDSTLIKPINTPITPLCTSMTSLTWETVRGAGTLKDAIAKLDFFLQEHVIKRNLDFSFITLNSWDLRMKLPKESRERSIMLPPYLELSRYFDLKKEFLKWQEMVHPEFHQSGVNQVSLTQILTQLDVDLSDFQPSTGTTNPQQQQLNLTPLGYPKRASDEVQIMIRILKLLVKKLPYNLPVLNQPHDSHLDLKQFFQEKSKILYMSNLPIDTTQSELESWFTQFGGRPIAFWTLKNTLEQQSHHGNNQQGSGTSSVKPTANGFAIFATHDEAVDSLSMNGRTLNDRVIEVQPSSIRVLDRSQEILTPFPSSKNRPRPGDWTCPSCGFSNFQRRTACFRCSFPAASAAAIQESMYSNKNFNSPAQQHLYHSNNSSHSHNNGSSTHDFSGLGHHPGQPNQHQHQQQQHQQHHQQHHQHQQQNRNSSSVPFRAGDWKCELCLYHNFAKNICCLKCGSPRSTNGMNNRQSNFLGANGGASNGQMMLPQSVQAFYSQSSTPTSSLLLTPQFMSQPQQSELILNQINSFNLNNTLYRSNTGSTNTNNSSGNLSSQQ